MKSRRKNVGELPSRSAKRAKVVMLKELRRIRAALERIAAVLESVGGR